jgi:CheY-like chemotaxis protein
MGKDLVLVVEDHPFMRDIIVDDILKPGGIDCLTTTSGLEAVKLVRHHPVNLLLLDRRLADTDRLGVDGFWVIQELKAQGFHIPVIMFTTAPEYWVKDKAYDEGVVDYIEVGENVTPEMFIKAVQHALESLHSGEFEKAQHKRQRKNEPRLNAHPREAVKQADEILEPPPRIKQLPTSYKALVVEEQVKDAIGEQLRNLPPGQQFRLLYSLALEVFAHMDSADQSEVLFDPRTVPFKRALNFPKAENVAPTGYNNISMAKVEGKLGEGSLDATFSAPAHPEQSAGVLTPEELQRRVEEVQASLSGISPAQRDEIVQRAYSYGPLKPLPPKTIDAIDTAIEKIRTNPRLPDWKAGQTSFELALEMFKQYGEEGVHEQELRTLVSGGNPTEGSMGAFISRLRKKIKDENHTLTRFRDPRRGTYYRVVPLP